MTAPTDLEAPDPRIQHVLPHRAPMLLVESVLERRDGFVACRCRIGRDTPLAGERGIPSVLALELGAQASALLDHGTSRHAAGGSGYLVSIRRAALHRATLPLEVSLRAEARLVGRAGGLQIVRVRIAREDEPATTLAEADLGTFVTRDSESGQ